MSRLAQVRRLLRHPLILSFYLPALFFALAEGLLIPILPLYASELAGNYGLIGLVLAGEGLGTLLGNLPAGILLRYLGTRRSMLMGLALIALATLALIWVEVIWVALALRLLAGASRSIFSVARHTHVTDVTSVAKRGRSIALFGGVFRIGSFVGPAVAGFVAERLGLRVPFALFGVACAVAMIFVARYVGRETGGDGLGRRPARARRRPVKARRRPTRAGKSPIRARRTTQARGRPDPTGVLAFQDLDLSLLARAGAGQLFAQLVRSGRRVIIPLYAADVLGLDAEAIGVISSLSSAIDMTLFLPVGWIMDHWGRKFTTVPSFLGLALGLALVPLTGNFTGLLLVSLLIGFANGLGSGNMMTLGSDLAPEERRGEFLGIWQLIGGAGYTGGPLIFGLVANWLALTTAIWVISSGGLVAALIFLLLVPETLMKKDEGIN